MALPALSIVLAAGCATSDPGPGSASEVVIATKIQGPQPSPVPAAPQPEPCAVIDAPDEAAGLLAERRWLHDHYPGWRNAFVHNLSVAGDPAHRRYFDRDQIVTDEGRRITVCFDITAFYGRH